MKSNIILIFCLLLSSACIAQLNTAKAYIDKARTLIDDKKDAKGALETLSTGINEMPDSVELHIARGALLDAVRLYDEALMDFSMGIEKTNDIDMKSKLLSNMGATKCKIRDFKGAYDDLSEAIRLDSTNLDALNNLAAVADEVGKPEETLKYLYQIIQVDPTYVPAYVNIGFKYQIMGKHENAITYFDKAVELAPDEALGYSNRSFSKLKSNDLRGAMKDIKKSIKLFPSNSYAYKIKALIQIEKNKISSACKDLYKADELGYLEQYGEEVNELKTKYCK